MKTGRIALATGYNTFLSEQIGSEEYIRTRIVPLLNYFKERYEKNHNCVLNPISEIIVFKEPIYNYDGDIIELIDMAKQDFIKQPLDAPSQQA